MSLTELEDYVHNLEPVAFAHQTPLFPVSKNNVLQFPQPGARDAEERKDYIPDHMPPLVSLQEGQYTDGYMHISVCVFFVFHRFESWFVVVNMFSTKQSIDYTEHKSVCHYLVHLGKINVGQYIIPAIYPALMTAIMFTFC